MPSATTSMWSARHSDTTASTIAVLASELAIRITNERSIFT